MIYNRQFEISDSWQVLNLFAATRGNGVHQWMLRKAVNLPESASRL
jgi:hypothetical protein